MKTLILIAALLAPGNVFACDGLHLNIGFGKDGGDTFPKTASDFRLEYDYKYFYAAYQHHSTLEDGWPFDGKDKNTSDMWSVGVKIKLW